jgi:hypothetical protein
MNFFFFFSYDFVLNVKFVSVTCFKDLQEEKKEKKKRWARWAISFSEEIRRRAIGSTTENLIRFYFLFFVFTPAGATVGPGPLLAYECSRRLTLFSA